MVLPPKYIYIITESKSIVKYDPIDAMLLKADNIAQKVDQ